MQQSPFLGVMKILAFLVLAFLVWLTWWQGDRREEKVDQTRQQISQVGSDVTQMRAVIDELSAANKQLTNQSAEQAKSLDALLDKIKSGGSVNGSAGTNSTSDGSSGEGTKSSGNTGPTRNHAKTPAPAYLSDAAKKLWGRYDDYFEPEDDPIEIPEFTTEGADVSGRIRRWWGSTQPSKINAITASDGNLTTGIKAYCQNSVGGYHDRNPSFYKPDLAVRVEVNREEVEGKKKFCEWIVFIRDDVYWHPPQVDLEKYPHLKGEHKVTAHDFAFALNDLILNEAVDCAHIRSYYSECEGIEVVGDYCFIVRWKKPQWNSIAFTMDLTPCARFVFEFDESGRKYDKEELGAAFNEHWFYRDFNFLGTGPYYVAQFDPSSHVLLRRFDRYFGQRRLIKEIYQEFFAEPKLNVQKLENGEFDYGSISPKNWDKKVNKEGENPFNDGTLEEEWVWSTSYVFIAWKMTNKIFKDVNVRRAMTMACNRGRIRDVIQLGKSKIITGPQHVNSPFSPPNLAPLPFDLKKAAATLKKAGWTDSDGDGLLDKQFEGEEGRTTFRFKAKVPAGGETFPAIFEIFKEDLRKIGVEMTLEFTQWKQFVEEALDGREFECTALAWSGTGWESDLYQIWHSSQVKEIPSSNFIEFEDKIVDDLIIKLRGTFDIDERLRLQRKAHTRLAELQPYTFLTTTRVPVFARKSRIGNFRASTRFAVRPPVRMDPMYVK